VVAQPVLDARDGVQRVVLPSRAAGDEASRPGPAVRDELGAAAGTLDLADAAGLRGFFAELPEPVDHVLVSGGGPIPQ
jgi:hypothetical protein